MQYEKMKKKSQMTKEEKKIKKILLQSIVFSLICIMLQCMYNENTQSWEKNIKLDFKNIFLTYKNEIHHKNCSWV